MDSGAYKKEIEYPKLIKEMYPKFIIKQIFMGLQPWSSLWMIT